MDERVIQTFYTKTKNQHYFFRHAGKIQDRVSERRRKTKKPAQTNPLSYDDKQWCRSQWFSVWHGMVQNG
jgi:hypothetical protein